MTLDHVLTPLFIIWAIGFAAALTCTQIKNRRWMMITKTIAEGFNGTYILLMGGISGALACYIAGLGGLVQALTPDKYLHATKLPRITGAILLSIAAIFVTYHQPLDAVPLAAIIFCRFMELHHNPERIRLAYYLAGFPWMYYLFEKEIYFSLFSVACMNVMFLVGLIRHRPKRQEVMDPA
ncbi:MAG: YgjV family protein [Alphaproteobacteria bacterium]|nr:YgjV family protein [Alphaproteobacteria bacterium]